MSLTKPSVRRHDTPTPLPLRRYSQHALAGYGLDPAELMAWADRCCGIACLQTILHYWQLPVPELDELLHNGWSRRALGPKGWILAKLLDMAGHYGLTGRAHNHATPADVERFADSGIPVIVSITYLFPTTGATGGHLVVYGGQDGTDGPLQSSFADPSSWGATHARIPPEQFWYSFSGRMVALWPQDLTGPGTMDSWPRGR